MVDLSGAGNLGYFSNITTPTQFTVRATIQVTFVGAKGLMKNVPQTQTVQTVSQAMIGHPTVSAGSVITPTLMILFGLLL